MRRADRLFEIIQILRRKKATQAADLVAILEVSERTICRDIADMVSRGVLIDGERRCWGHPRWSSFVAALDADIATAKTRTIARGGIVQFTFALFIRFSKGF